MFKNLLIKMFLNYIRMAAKLQLLKYKLLNKNFKIIGISGSAGKTSTMNAIYAVLKDSFKVKYSYKANSETGIPLDILGFSHPESYSYFEWLKYSFLVPFALLFYWKYYDVYIVEMGVDSIEEPKNMKYLLKILVPDIAVYINVTATHAENYQHRLVVANFSDQNKLLDFRDNVIDLIAKDKSLLISAVDSNGVVLLNMNDIRVAKTKILSKARVLEIYGDEGYNVKNRTWPKHYDINFEFAIKISEIFGLTKDFAINQLSKNFDIEPGRATLFSGLYNSILIDSTYNSSKEACMDMIDYMHEVDNKSYKIAVLGDMRELGISSKIEHEELATYSFGKISEYYLLGPLMAEYFYNKLVSIGVNKSSIHLFSNRFELLEKLELSLIEQEKTKLNTTILLKGSQNTIFLEDVVEQLLLNKSDVKFLCRRGNYWNNIRSVK